MKRITLNKVINFVCMLCVLSFSGACQRMSPVKVVLSTNKKGNIGAKPLPVIYKKITSTSGEQPVLTMPVIVVLNDSTEITLPKGTFISNEYTIGKAYLPSDHNITVRLGENTITPEKVIVFESGYVSAIGLSGKYALKVGKNVLKFMTNLGGIAVGFYESGQVKCGFLAEQTSMALDENTLYLDNAYVDRYDDDGFGNISFYEDGSLKNGVLAREAKFNVKEMQVCALPGFIRLHDNGSLEMANLKDDFEVKEAHYSFTFLARSNHFTVDDGDRIISFTKDGKLIGDFVNVVNLRAKEFDALVPAAIISIASEGWFPYELYLKNSSIKVKIKIANNGLAEVPFGPSPDRRENDIVWGLPDILFSFKSWDVEYGYLADTIEIQNGKYNFCFAKQSIIKFRRCKESDCGMVSEGVLGKDYVMDKNGVKFKLLRGYPAKFFEDGELVSNFDSPWAHQKDYVVRLN